MKKGYLILTVLVAGALGLAACAPAQTAAEEQDQSQRTIAVSGSGEASAVPDLAYFALGVTSRGESVSETVARSNELMTAVVQAILDMGVEANDIQTSGFSVWSEEVPTPYGEVLDLATAQTIYRVNNEVRVTVREVQKVADLIQAGLDAGANQVNGVNFAVEDTTALEEEARQKAIEDLQARAADLAEKMGLQLGKILSLSEGVQSGLFPAYDFAVPAAMGGGPPISLGEVMVTVQVNAVFSIQ
jgi:uncharacterized protein YggE